MAVISPLDYAKKYWDLEFPIINDDNQIVRYEKVRFGKYRLHQGWGQTPPVEPPGLSDFRNAVMRYADGFFNSGKALELRVKNIWGSDVFLRFRTRGEFRQLLTRAVQAFSGKGSPEDVQLTLQLAVRCGVATHGIQQYCDERVDTYARLGLDCNGFVGNYLRYRHSETQWNYYDPVSSAEIINADMGISLITLRLGSQAVENEDAMFTPRLHVLAMVNKAGMVINGGFGPVGHIMILEAINSVQRQAVYPPVPKEYLSGQYLWYSGVEATPAVGLSRIAYAILKIDKDGVATVWRDEVKNLIKVKIYPVL